MKRAILKLIRIYQSTLSLDHGPLSKHVPGGFCKFQPSCSQYAYESIEKYGLIRGGFKGVWRIIRCNPFNKGGYDPV